ncbi:MAG: hypothetical protein HKN76_13710, partial [Saprospiraceae bacterium]|nr:hypothetical protein [Saprospiraceae bacterium]
AFRQIDILYELAFFCMDLDAEGFEELSDHFIKAYRKLYPEVLMESSDTVLLLYYKLYRANVRAKVTVLKVEQADNNQERQTFIKEAEKYLDLMQGYLTKLS